MAEEKLNKTGMILFWIIFAVVIVGGGVYFGLNNNQSAENTSTGCNVTVKDGTASEVDKLGPNDVQITAENFDAEVMQAKGVVLVDVYAPWCPHCQKIAPTITKIADDYVGKVKVGKMNANNQDSAMKANFDFAIKNGLEGYPTIWIYKDGQKVDEFSGERTYCEIKEMLDKQL